MNVMLLHNNHRYVSAIRVANFRVMRTRIKCDYNVNDINTN